jgi:hypothetical protein
MSPARLSLAVTLALVLALPVAQASAAQTLVVAPGSVRVTQPCTAATPCEFKYAVGAAQAGDDVLFTAGEYDYTPPTSNKTLTVNAGVTLHGAPGQPLPLIKQAVGYTTCTCPMLELASGDSAHDLALDCAIAPASG